MISDDRVRKDLVLPVRKIAFALVLHEGFKFNLREARCREIPNFVKNG